MWLCMITCLSDCSSRFCIWNSAYVNVEQDTVNGTRIVGLYPQVRDVLECKLLKVFAFKCVYVFCLLIATLDSVELQNSFPPCVVVCVHQLDNLFQNHLWNAGIPQKLEELRSHLVEGMPLQRRKTPLCQKKMLIWFIFPLLDNKVSFQFFLTCYSYGSNYQIS